MVCRQLGYDGGELACYKHLHHVNRYHNLTFLNPEAIPLQSHIALTNATFYNLDFVHCDGNESKLSECLHGGVGAHSCGEISDEVEVGGAVCYSKSFKTLVGILLLFF